MIFTAILFYLSRLKTLLINYIPYRELMQHLDIKSGNVLYVASNIIKMKMLALKHEGEFDLNNVIKALQEKITAEGTLLLPAFNFSVSSHPTFDIQKTPPATGTLPITVFAHPDFKRTAHPLHSFMVWGKAQKELIEMDNISSFGKYSPFGFMHRNNAFLLSIDLDLQHSLAQTHFVEEQEKVPYRRWKNYRVSYTSNGKTTLKTYQLYHKKPGWINDVNPLIKLFLKNGISHQQTLNGIHFTLTNLTEVYPILASDIKNNKARNIARFVPMVFCKQLVKMAMGKPII